MFHRTYIANLKKHLLSPLLLIALLFSLLPAFQPSVAVYAEGEPASYVILAEQTLPDDLAQQIIDAGGTLTSAMSEIGVAVVESTDPNFAANAGKIEGISSVTRDVSVKWVTGQDFTWTGQDFTYTGQDFTWTGQDFTYTGQAQNPPNTLDDDFFFNFQWNLDAINAPDAWELGAKGQGVRIAVLDAGFELTTGYGFPNMGHPDFIRFDYNTMSVVSNMDVASGTSFVPGTSFQFDNTLPTTSHGTHVAGIIAAADNGLGIIGVAPEATIVPIKVLRDFDLQGDFAWIIQGIYYATTQDVDVINMSLGAALPRDGYCDDTGVCVGANEIAELVKAMKLATDYAAKQGITIVAAAGNVAPGDPTQDMDHVGNLIFLPADLPNVLSISATGPNGWGLDSTTDLDLPAFYTRYGQSYIDFAAPGGNVDLAAAHNPDHPLQDSCMIGFIEIPVCGGADLIPSTLAANSGQWGWLLGTSMAAPHAAGIAALIIGQNGGSMQPAQVEAKLRQSADDLGKPGNDDLYGGGRLNALRAVQ